VTQPVFQATVINKYDVQYYQCPSCQFLQTEKPIWLEEAYSSAITLSDTGIMSRNMHFSRLVTSILYFFFKRKGNYLDYAGGYGLFTRIMRDLGNNFYWQDPYCQNLVARGFEFKGGNLDGLTTFESFEHFENPKEELEKILQYSRNIIFSTQTLPNGPLPEKTWDYYGFEHGQHISIYSMKSLQHLADLHRLHLTSNGYLHILSEKPIPKLVFKFLLKFNNYGIFYLITKQLKSKTLSDMYLIRDKINMKK
jgi:hypothetical protein